MSSTATARYAFTDAGADDEAALRSILSSTPLPGWATISFEREPSYFAACPIEGDSRTLLASTNEGEPVGFFSRSVRRAWINGEHRRLGYLGQLRVLPHWRARSRVILRGFEQCRELLNDGRQETPYYLTSILSDNTTAARLLNSGIKGMPTYLPVSEFVTLVASTKQGFAALKVPRGFKIRQASPSDLDSIATLLQTYGRQFGMYPYWDSAELRALGTVGWDMENTLLLLKDGQPVGCGTLWDQRACRQQRVTGYAPLLAGTRSLLNVPLKLAGYPVLPRPGKVLNQAFLSHLAIMAGNEQALPGLAVSLLNLARTRRLDTVVLGFADTHPYLAALRKLRALRYRSRFFLVHWDEGRQAARDAARQAFHTEVACL